jgi:hypothetical protein
MSSQHERLWSITRKLPQDYEPYGTTERNGPDCSRGCRFARPLQDTPEEQLSMDWLVCTNHKSHRVGLLTFEHQAGEGCFEPCPKEEP